VNCPCCSAPLAPTQVVCAYCGSRLDVDLEGWARAEISGSWSDRHCPDCRQPLDSVRLGDGVPVSLGRCPGCRGMFLEPGSIEILLSRGAGTVWEVNRPLLQALVEAPRAPVAPLRYRRCPCCDEPMNRSLFGRRSGVIVDRCREHGLWLDSGELRQLLEWTRAGGRLLHQERLEEEERARERQERRAARDNAHRIGRLEAEVAQQRRQQNGLELLARGLTRLLG
jgi:Zn-finger nucleic acid-binding protein